MKLPDDDELYQIDQTYLGPPGRYLGVLRHKAIFAWFALGPLTFVTAYGLGIPMTFLSVGLILLGTIWASMWLADKATSERPITALFVTFWHDLTSPRARRKPYHATGRTIRQSTLRMNPTKKEKR